MALWELFGVSLKVAEDLWVMNFVNFEVEVQLARKKKK